MCLVQSDYRSPCREIRDVTLIMDDLIATSENRRVNYNDIY